MTPEEICEVFKNREYLGQTDWAPIENGEILSESLFSTDAVTAVLAVEHAEIIARVLVDRTSSRLNEMLVTLQAQNSELRNEVARLDNQLEPFRRMARLVPGYWFRNDRPGLRLTEHQYVMSPECASVEQWHAARTAPSADHGDYAVIWSFTVKPECVSAFELAYGAEGPWCKFFQESEDWLGTTLFRLVVDEPIYQTIDRWKSKEAYDRVRAHPEYRDLDERMRQLTVKEEFVAVIR